MTVMQEPPKEAPPIVAKPPFKERVAFALKMGSHQYKAMTPRPDSQQAEDQYDADLQHLGVEARTRRIMRVFAAARRKGSSDKEQFHTFDRYLAGGSVVLDLVLLAILAAQDKFDPPVFVSLFAFICSLPLAGGSLFLSFVRKEYRIPSYWTVHSTMAFWGALGAIISYTAFVWHLSVIAGVVSLLVTFGVILVCGLYWWFYDAVKHTPPGALEDEAVKAKRHAALNPPGMEMIEKED